MANYVIFSFKETLAQTDGQPMFWSNLNGWGTLGEATTFSSREIVSVQFPLPDDSTAIRLPPSRPPKIS